MSDTLNCNIIEALSDKALIIRKLQADLSAAQSKLTEHEKLNSDLITLHAGQMLEKDRKIAELEACIGTPEQNETELKDEAARLDELSKLQSRIAELERKLAEAQAKLSERKTVHEWLNSVNIPQEENGKPLCLLRRLRITCDKLAEAQSKIREWESHSATQHNTIASLTACNNTMQEAMYEKDRRIAELESYLSTIASDCEGCHRFEKKGVK